MHKYSCNLNVFRKTYILNQFFFNLYHLKGKQKFNILFTYDINIFKFVIKKYTYFLIIICMYYLLKSFLLYFKMDAFKVKQTKQKIPTKIIKYL